MNNGNVSHEGTKTRRVENLRHTRAGGYPGSRQRFIQLLVGQFGQHLSVFVTQTVAQMIDSIKVQQPAALFPVIQTGRGL
ncbi:hypothetical protein SAMN05421880_1229 [Nitrosomonas nitrosa]|uniref:Uncharacterized protein n=1 Tax=Nitrosomonas nitrosa TaxID=52442 RepID=A0A1I4S1F7_9PROT|nr:hypothetical protein [Nitrosomonas nitrosa]SFM58251.1 hypothetical protein SAMN05421880_1229 [Nitrosomonas nitrosa]